MPVNLDWMVISIIVNTIIISPVLWLSGRALVGKEKARFTDAVGIVVLGTVVGTIFGAFFTGIIASIIQLIILASFSQTLLRLRMADGACYKHNSRNNFRCHNHTPRHHRHSNLGAMVLVLKDSNSLFSRTKRLEHYFCSSGST